MGVDYKIFPFLGSFTHVTSILNSYYMTENFIVKNDNNNLLIFPYNKKLEIDFEEQYSLVLNNLNLTYISKLRKEYIEYRHKANYYKKMKYGLYMIEKIWQVIM